MIPMIEDELIPLHEIKGIFKYLKNIDGEKISCRQFCNSSFSKRLSLHKTIVSMICLKSSNT